MKTVAILGANGAVGREMLKILQERDFPLGRLLLLGSHRSAGKRLFFRGEELPIQEAGPDSFRDCDIVLGAAENAVAKAYAPSILDAGAVFVDNSSAFRLESGVPLVVPEVNGADVKKHAGIIANPNCSTIISLTAVSGIARLRRIESIVASTYQAVSGAGAAGLTELESQLRGENAPPQVFPYPIACNLIPQIGGQQEDGYTSEEMKLQYESRKILHLPKLRVSCTCVRVPVLRCHCISLRLLLDGPLSVAQARAAVENAPGCVLTDDLEAKRYPMPLEVADQDLVSVGRIRPDLTQERGLLLWCCGDQLRKGAATNAVQIAELL